MQLTLLNGYPDMVGRRRIFCGYGAGPTSYSQTTGDVLSTVGYEVYWDNIFPTAIDPTGNFYAVPRPSAVGPRATWSLHWYYAPGNTVGGTANAEVTANTNLSTYSLQVAGFGGQY